MNKYLAVPLICSLLVAYVQAIMGGSRAMIGQFPYLVNLKFNEFGYSIFCGGSIISSRYILTAASCVLDVNNNFRKYPASHMTIYAGAHQSNNDGVAIAVAKTIVHPKFRKFNTTADIALVKLATPLTFSEFIQPIEPSSRGFAEDTPVKISGWGCLQKRGRTAIRLQWLVLKNLSQLDCQIEARRLTNDLICLNHIKNVGICTGDFGGPAVVGQLLVGVAAASMKTSDAYVNVASYYSWIKNNSDLKLKKAIICNLEDQ